MSRRPPGSPALAGIIPHDRPAAVWGLGLPRTRGDHPMVTILAEERLAAPPHSRGSSQSRKVRAQAAVGSPALAGIIPISSAATSYPVGLPRTRGDHPGSGLIWPSCGSAPPHSRGSSQSRKVRAQAAVGSPALAGIIPISSAATSYPVGLPRTRGDHPGSGLIWPSCGSAPPHSRGSSRARNRKRSRSDGSPALAGIIPD